MNCTNCGQVLPAGATACPNCGTAVAAAPAAGAPATGAPQASAPQAGVPQPGYAGAPPAHGAVPAFKFDAARWTRADRITGIATLVLLISLFLTWFTVSVNASVGGVNYGGSYGGSGVSAHGYLYLVFLICLAVLALLVLKAGWGEMPFKMPLAETQLVLIATVVNLVLVLIAFLLKPSAGLSGLHVGWGYGAFVALIAAIVACAPTAVPAIQARRHQA